MTYPTRRKTETCSINGVEYKTHYWYMDCAKDLTGAERHRIYMRQFCTPRVMAVVSKGFNKAQWAEMAKAYNDGDIHLNNCTKLSQWDFFNNTVKQIVGRLVTDCTYEDAPKGIFYWSPSQNTSITKNAAIWMIEENTYPQ